MISSIRPASIDTSEVGVILANLGLMTLEINASFRDQNAISEMDETVRSICISTELDNEVPVLVGFSSTERKDFYRALRKIKGVGRQSALKVLDCGSVADTLRAVAAKDTTYFQEVPGIGAKRIEQVLLKLGTQYREVLPTPVTCTTSVWVAVRDAMVGSGMDEYEAEMRLMDALSDVPDVATGDQMLKEFAAKI